MDLGQEFGLNLRELYITWGVCRGRSNATLAKDFGTTERAIGRDFKKIFFKTRTSSLEELALLAQKAQTPRDARPAPLPARDLQLAFARTWNLNPREAEVVYHLWSKKVSSREIAAAMHNISIRKIDACFGNIYRKSGERTRAGLIAAADQVFIRVAKMRPQEPGADCGEPRLKVSPGMRLVRIAGRLRQIPIKRQSPSLPDNHKPAQHLNGDCRM